TPMNVCFRGRINHLPAFNYHATHYTRALINFAQGKKIGEHGLPWLLRYAANCAEGIDDWNPSKRTWEEREKWAVANLDFLVSVGRTSDEAQLSKVLGKIKRKHRFQFLAVCLELAEIFRAGLDSPDYDHVTHVPVAFDGSSNGLQHLCAIT